MKTYSLACKDMGIDCPWVGKADSKEEVMKMAKEHTQKAHKEEADKMAEEYNEEEMKDMMMEKMKEE